MVSEREFKFMAKRLGDKKQIIEGERPSIYLFHDFLEFIKAQLGFLQHKKGWSLRIFAKKVELAPSYLSMCLNGKRPLTREVLEKIMPYLGLNPSEQRYLGHLHTVALSTRT